MYFLLIELTAVIEVNSSHENFVLRLSIYLVEGLITNCKTQLYVTDSHFALFQPYGFLCPHWEPYGFL